MKHLTCTVCAILGVLLTAVSSHALPSFQEVKQNYQASDAVLLDRHGKVIHEVRIDAQGRRLDWTRFNDISPALVKAIIHSEDKRFPSHHGVDWLATGTTAFENLFVIKPRGASTITMQLVSLLDAEFKPKQGKRTLAQKWDQMRAAQELERSWSKDTILEAYVNLVSFRGELQGITAASRGLFNKEPGGLDEAEAILLASLIRSPNAGIEAATKRAQLLAESLNLTLKPEELAGLVKSTLARPYHVRPHVALASQAAQQLMRNTSPGERSCKSTLDRDIQQYSAEVLLKQLSLLRKKNAADGAILVVENRTGNVLAYIGNAGSAQTRYVDGIRARRQAGSTLKPFLYALAFEKRILTPASLMSDAPLDVSTEKGIYKPENYDKEFRGIVTARTALASSLNIPAVRTLSLVGMPEFVSRLRSLGFAALKEDDYYGLSLALGSADVTLWELVNAYRTLANNGTWSELRMAPAAKRKAAKQAVVPEAAFIVSDILSDREARSATFSLESPLATRFWTAVKTGTSKDMRDNWCIGYSANYTVGVWVGNFSGAPMWDVSGITGAAPAWQEIMQYLERDSRSVTPVPPRTVVARSIVIPGQGRSSRREWFITGTEPDIVERTKAPQKILYPASGTIIAIDPDIPVERQKIYFESTAAGRMTWELNDVVIGQEDTIAWIPRIGIYTLRIRDLDNRGIDEVEFEVR